MSYRAHARQRQRRSPKARFASWLKAEATPWIITIAGFVGLCAGIALGVSLELRDEGVYWLGGIGGVGAMIFTAWLRYGRPGLKRHHLKRLAQTRDWTFEDGPNPRIVPARGLPFSLGGRHTTLDMARGLFNGTEFTVFYHRVRHTGDRTDAVEYFTVFAAHVEADLPVTTATPQRGRHALAAAVGLPDLKVENAAFNATWRIRATDTRSGMAIIEPRTMERMMQPDLADLSITWDANAVMIVERGRRKDFSRIDDKLTVLTELAALVPDYYKRETTHGDAAGT